MSAPPRAPRVLVCGAVLGQPAGGVRRHNAELLPRAAERLAQAGGALAVAIGRTPPGFALPDTIEQLPTDVPAGPPLARALREGRALRRLLRAAAEGGAAFDLVHTAHLPAPRGLGVPYTLTVHDLRSLHLSELPALRRLVARPLIAGAVRRAAGVITVSETVRTELAERFHPRCAFVVPNGADHLPVLPRSPGPDAPLLFVGQVEPRKNLAVCLRALALDPTLPDLAIAGRARPAEEARLRALAAELGVARRVRFLGPQPEEDLPVLYATAACVVLPSRLEGFGIPALEALRAGAPLAIADAFALPEVAGPDVPRFAPDDAAGCARACRAALGTSAELQRAGAQRAASYTWDAAADALVAAWHASARAGG